MGKVADLKARLATPQPVTPEELPRVLFKLLEEYIQAALFDVVTEAVQVASEKVKKDTGKYSTSLKNARVVVTRIRVMEYHTLLGAVASDGDFLEEGRDPGKQPPPKKLQAWVTKHLGLTGSEAKSVAYLIGRKIAKGVAGDHIIQQAVDQVAASGKY